VPRRIDDTRSSDDTWSDPLEVLAMRGEYDWRKYTKHGPFFLCRSGRPIEVQGTYGNWWRCCTFEPGASDELREFVKAMAN